MNWSYLIIENKTNGKRYESQPYDLQTTPVTSRVINGKLYIRFSDFFPLMGFELGWSKASGLGITGKNQNYITINTPIFLTSGTIKKVLQR